MREKPARNLALVLATILVLSTGFNNCGQRTRMNLKDSSLLSSNALALGGTSGGNPARSLKFGPYQSPLAGNVGSSLGIAEFSICIAEFDFISVDGSHVPLKFNRELRLAEGGTPIPDVTVPAGEYSQVVAVVADACGTNRSLLVANRSGGLASSASANMVFDGPFSSDGEHDLTLDIVNIAQSMADSVSEQTALESLSQIGTVTATSGPGN